MKTETTTLIVFLIFSIIDGFCLSYLIYDDFTYDGLFFLSVTSLFLMALGAITAFILAVNPQRLKMLARISELENQCARNSNDELISYLKDNNIKSSSHLDELFSVKIERDRAISQIAEYKKKAENATAAFNRLKRKIEKDS